MSEEFRNILFLVGDRFRSFASHEEVRTVSQFVADVRAGEHDSLPSPLLLWESQGIGAYERDYIREVLEARGLSRKVLLQPNDPDVVSRAQAHKHREQNVLLSGLNQAGDDHYRASLRVHDDNELLLDHQTGEHVQGMVVIEAFRQMFMAFTEKFVASQWPKHRYYYIWHAMDVRFESFLFPLDAGVSCTVVSSDTTNPDRLKMTVDLEMHQAQTRAATARIDFTAYDAERLAPKEHRLAASTVTSLLGSSSNEPVRTGSAHTA
ncbi:AfsA-related hotdog domain-containing protein [Streptomyces sp. NPDC048384]|uniref:AfsA-related hotdog domain-containing protein n=1 Tax=Streptomyces sp. NPDC048384 TaxID=3155487 RepID=UPI0034429E6B